jgi:DNA-binding NarL/FixJ family response regulator
MTKILIIDDHAVIRTGLRQVCASVSPGADILEAERAQSALELQKNTQPRLTILDLNMPGVGGLELLRQLLEADANARVLVFSMHGEPVYAAKALEIGARGYEQERLARRVANGLIADSFRLDLCASRDRAASGRACQ